GSLIPEPGDGALLGAASGAGLLAEALDLVVVPRVIVARQRRGTSGRELRAAGEGERGDVAPPRQLGGKQSGPPRGRVGKHRVGGRRPLPRSGSRRIRRARRRGVEA